jgi:hypothetical protein
MVPLRCTFASPWARLYARTLRLACPPARALRCATHTSNRSPLPGRHLDVRVGARPMLPTHRRRRAGDWTFENHPSVPGSDPIHRNMQLLHSVSTGYLAVIHAGLWKIAETDLGDAGMRGSGWGGWVIVLAFGWRGSRLTTGDRPDGVPIRQPPLRPGAPGGLWSSFLQDPPTMSRVRSRLADRDHIRSQYARPLPAHDRLADFPRFARRKLDGRTR